MFRKGIPCCMNRLAKVYQITIKKILEFLNYNEIKNEKGNSHWVLNVIDILLAASYMVFSIVRLKDVSIVILIINGLTLTRLMIGNLKQSILLRDKYEELYNKRPGLLFKSAHDLKLIIELCAIGLVLIPFAALGQITNIMVIKAFAGIIIAFGFIESLINSFVVLFKASIYFEKANEGGQTS